MKRLILSICALATCATLSFGQYTQAGGNTGFTYNTSAATSASGSGYSWAFYGPDCVGGSNGGGGADNGTVGTLGLQWGQAAAGDMYVIFIPAVPLDLSTVANQKLSITLRNENGSGAALPLTYYLRLQDGSNTDLLTTNSVPLAVTGSNQTFNIDFSTHTSGSLASVVKIILYYNGCPSSFQAPSRLIATGNFKVGSTLTTAVTNAQSVTSEPKLYPNPTNDMANVELNLNGDYAVKIVLNDMLGKEVKVITEQSASSISTSFSTAGINKGIYSVVYLVDGTPVKTQMLVIK